MIDVFGLFSINALYPILVLLILLIAAFVMILNFNKKLKDLTRRYELFMGGRDAKTMEEVITGKLNEIEDIKVKEFKNSTDIAEIFDRLEKTVCKVGLVKYDAFNKMGGKLSFSLAMLNEKSSGVILNSMHGPEGSYVYMKEIVNGQSYVALGEEEQKALNLALDKVEE